MITIKWVGVAVCAVTLTCVHPGSALQNLHIAKGSNLCSVRNNFTQILQRHAAVYGRPLARVSREFPNDSFASIYRSGIEVPLRAVTLPLPRSSEAVFLLGQTYSSGRAPPAA